MQNNNIVYVLTNEAYEEVKIGYTKDDLNSRIKKLSSPSGVPLPFECFYAAEIIDMDCFEVEQLLHQLFAEYRINDKREFFAIDPSKAVIALGLVAHKDVTPRTLELEAEEEQALARAKKQSRAKFSFSKINIPPNTKLTFARDASEVCTVLNDTEVVYDNTTHSISGAANAASEKLYPGRYGPLSGPVYWVYEGKTLRQLAAEI